jgi:hypothetical protein
MKNKTRDQIVRKKTIKYFIQQKLIELFLAIVVIFGVTVVPFLLSFIPTFIGINVIPDESLIICSYGSPSSCAGEMIIVRWGIGWLVLIVLSLVILALSKLFASNWNKAKKIAEAETP